MRLYVTIVTSITAFHILRPGKMQKKSHLGGAPETKLYFLALDPYETYYIQMRPI